MKHIPVLLKEAIEFLNVKEGGVYIDSTLGYGGHTEEILKKIGSQGIVIGIEWDEDAIKDIYEKFQSRKNQLRVICDNYSNIKKIANDFGYEYLDGILFDLGTNIHQIKESDKGFSFLRDGPLDMRFNKKLSDLPAYEIINTWPKDKLERLFRESDEWRAAIIVRAIVEERRVARILTTGRLADIITRAVHGRHGKIHPATKVFQALRIAVNSEYENIKKAIPESISLLKKGGRLVVITFHSGEDRIIKNLFKEFASKGDIKILTKKTIAPKYEEIKANPLSRSAKLRAVERI